MSNQTNSFLSPLDEEAIKNIDQLNLSIIQKHHVRLLAHCLEILKKIALRDENPFFDEDEALREWCEKQSQEFNDKKFNKLFYEQMSSASKKLNSYSKKAGKKFKELDIEDLIILVKLNS